MLYLPLLLLLCWSVFFYTTPDGMLKHWGLILATAGGTQKAGDAGGVLEPGSATASYAARARGMSSSMMPDFVERLEKARNAFGYGSRQDSDEKVAAAHSAPSRRWNRWFASSSSGCGHGKTVYRNQPARNECGWKQGVSAVSEEKGRSSEALKVL